ncbi:MAG: VWA domain-containing protein, partial [Planctomycetota bacterium]|nr:VWA domain-containing protein [Planctomycetota bacterium]
MMKRTNRHASFLRALAASIALTAALSLFPGQGFAAAAEPMRAVLLNRDLGDPGNPVNAKLAILMPPALMDEAESIAAGDFRVYAHPAGLDRDEGLDDRYLARGVYLWRSGDRIFLDVRSLPRQDAEGRATVRVVYAPQGAVRAEAVAEGEAHFTSDLVDVVLAIDASLSMNRSDPGKRRVAAARTFIDMAEQGGGVGRVALVTFNQRAALNTPLIPLSQGGALLDALNRIGSEGLTNLDEPLNVALNELRGARKPVIILLTDGKNEGHWYRNAHLRAAGEGVRIFSVGLSEQADHALLRNMADATGGIYFRAVKNSDLPGIYARLAAELGKRQLLHAETLSTPNGTMTIPVDGTVKRLVAVADGGGRVSVADPGTGLFSSPDMTSVHMGNPVPGNWNFSWAGAMPGVSTLGFFGDTRFFLDLFPPQLRRDHLAVGATLAEDDKPLTDASVWVEAIPGLLPGRLQLYDDGEHGDGGANDGVYGATVSLPGEPGRIDVIARADGSARERGDFVRQAAAPAFQTGEDPPGRVRLGSDVDFGVLFPGETGAAVATVELEAESPRDLTMNLSWRNGASEWPDFSSRISVSPGSHDFELEMTVPADSLPGDYAGSFTIGNAAAAARVKVGGIRFDHDGVVDLGIVPPGTFISRIVPVRYEADKAVPLSAATEGPEDLSVVDPGGMLPAGSGRIDVEAVVSAPMGTPEGERSGVLVLRAGPGFAEIPLRWQIKPYEAKADDIAPVPGLPRPPEFPSDAAPLQQTPELSTD